MNILKLKEASRQIFTLMIGLHFVCGACFLIAGEILFNDYKPIDIVEVLEIDDGYIFKSKELEFKNRDVGIKFSFGSHENSSNLPDFQIDHGSIDSHVVCDGHISNQSSYRLDGQYEYTNKYIYKTALENITINGCKIEIQLKSRTFSKYISNISVVRTGDGEFLGVDIRAIPKVFEVFIMVGYFVFLVYIGSLHGILAVLGVGVTFFSGGIYFYLRKKIERKKQ